MNNTLAALAMTAVTTGAISVEPRWVAVAITVVGALGSAPWIVTLILRRENRNLLLAQTQQAESTSGKTDIEAEQIRESIAQTWLDRYEAQFQAQQTQINLQSKRIAALEKHQDQQDELLMEHGAWDYQASERLRDCGVDLPPPPPLRVYRS